MKDPRHTYTKEDLQFIKDNYKTMTAKEIAQRLDCKADTVHLYACKFLNVGKAKKWTREEEDYLMSQYKRGEGRRLADYFGVTLNAVHQRMVLIKNRKK